MKISYLMKWSLISVSLYDSPELFMWLNFLQLYSLRRLYLRKFDNTLACAVLCRTDSELLNPLFWLRLYLTILFYHLFIWTYLPLLPPELGRRRLNQHWLVGGLSRSAALKVIVLSKRGSPQFWVAWNALEVSLVEGEGVSGVGGVASEGSGGLMGRAGWGSWQEIPHRRRVSWDY